MTGTAVEPFIGDALQRVRSRQPLVQCLTNTVTTSFVANVLLALGASPAMVDIRGEAGLLAGSGCGLLINLGTPPPDQRNAMLEAATAARGASSPWVLDPVGVGTLPVRTELARQLVALRPGIIRGNASEIRALAGLGAGGRGVDATDTVEAAEQAAVRLAGDSGAVVAVSGAVDLVTDGVSTVRIANGDPLFTRITGAGCALGAVLAAFAVVADEPWQAAVAGAVCYGVAGELAAARCAGPGSFAVELLDAIAGLNEQTVLRRSRVS